MEIQFKQWNCTLEFGKYANDRVAIELIDIDNGEPVAVATVNIPEAKISNDMIIIKNYSENAGMYEAFLNNGLIERSIESVRTGFVVCPVCIMTDKLKSLINTKE